MRITSSPKYKGQLQNLLTPSVRQNSILQNQNVHTKSLMTQKDTNIIKSTVSQKDKLYQELKNRQIQYVSLIRDLHKENRQLKMELGKVNESQRSKYSFTSIPIISNLSPSRFKLNQSFKIISPNSQASQIISPNCQANQIHSPRSVINKSFDSYANPVTQKISSFCKKPVIFQEVSPRLSPRLSPQIVSPRLVSPEIIRTQVIFQRNSPLKIQPMIKSPIKMLQDSRPLSKHSYTPSLTSYQSPQDLSNNNSPKKSFQVIENLNTEMFYAQTYNKENDKIFPRSIDTPSTVKFFDMKKRQLNYGSVFKKQVNPPTNTSQTILKLTSQKQITKNSSTSIQQISNHSISQKLVSQKVSKKAIIAKKSQSNFVGEIKEYPIDQNSIQENNIITKEKENIITKEKNNIIAKEQHHKINLQQNINRNPILSMLKKKLLEDGSIINGQYIENRKQTLIHNQSQYNMESPYNSNIRYSNKTIEKPSIQTEQFTCYNNQTFIQNNQQIDHLQDVQPLNQQKVLQSYDQRDVLQGQIQVQDRHQFQDRQINNLFYCQESQVNQLSDKKQFLSQVNKSLNEQLLQKQRISHKNEYQSQNQSQFLKQTKKVSSQVCSGIKQRTKLINGQLNVQNKLQKQIDNMESIKNSGKINNVNQAAFRYTCGESWTKTPRYRNNSSITGSESSQCNISSTTTLRSQKFKTISNKAYL